MKIKRLSYVSTFFVLFALAFGVKAASIQGTNPNNVNIPDGGAYVASTISIANAPAGAVVTGIDVTFRCVHSYSGDLVIDLNADSSGALGNRNLWNREGASADNPTRTVAGINTYNGLTVNRTWYLYAKDLVKNDSGYIDDWTITIYYGVPPGPSISNVAPISPMGSNSSQPFTINGANFVAGCNVTLRTGGSVYGNRAQSAFSSGAITINPTFTTTAANWTVEIINPDGKSSGQFPFVVQGPVAPSPSITSVNPAFPIGANAAQPFTINGANFVAGCNVTLRTGGSVFANRAQSAFSSGAITINPNFTTTAANWTVEIINPDGKSSGQFAFTVQAPVLSPSIASVNPASPIGANAAQPFTINGANFVAGCTVTLRTGGSVFANRAQSAFSMSAITINPNFTTAAASWTVEVTNPDGKSSGQFEFTVQAFDPNSFTLSFPLANRTSETAKINSVFDHSMTTAYTANQRVVAYSGETGTVRDDAVPPAVIGGVSLYSYKDTDGSSFVLNGNYSGAGKPTALNYDGHPGIDYRTTDQAANGQINVYAAAEGIAHLGSAAYNTVYIDHGNGYATFYLHLSQRLVAEGASITRGQIIGISGDTGAAGSPHLHFEVRLNGIEVDPYGWSGPGADPYTRATSVNLWKTRGGVSPSISGVGPASPVGSNTAQPFTITGANFVVGFNVTLRTGGSVFANRAQSSFSSGAITINPNFTTTAANWTVEVINPDGKSSGQFAFTVQGPVLPSPSIASVNPPSPIGANASQAFTINGANFVTGCNVTLRTGGSVYANRAQSAFSAGAITINPNFTTTAASWTVEVINPDGKSSGQFAFTVQAPVPSPSIASVNPASPIGSNVAQPFTINGANFVTGCNVTLRNGGNIYANRPQASFGAGAITINPIFTNAGADWTVEVINPDGKSSGQFAFTVQAPVPSPSIASVNPASPIGSNVGQPFTINGANFVPGCNVTLRNGGTLYANRPQASFGAGAITINPIFTNAGADWTVEVINPDGKSSGQFAFTVQAPVTSPSIISVNPASPIGSNSSQPFTINGAYFVAGCDVTLRSGGNTYPNRPQTSFGTGTITISSIFPIGIADWTVEVINPDGKSSGQFAFKVVGDMVILGIDVSTYQGNIDWTQVKSAGAKTFAIIRATAGKNTTDDHFLQNANGAVAAGLKVGAYHFAYPEYFSAHEEAQRFLNVARDYVGKGFLPPALDIEDSPTENSFPSRMGKESLSKWIYDWCSEVQKARSVKPMVYSSRFYARNHFDSSINAFRYWVSTDSGTSDSDPGDIGIWSSWTFQQYFFGESGGQCAGVVGPVDLCSFNGGSQALQVLVNEIIVPVFGGIEGESLQPPKNGQFHLGLQSDQQQISVQASSNMIDWLDIQVVPLSDGKATFIDTTAGLHTSRFYRKKP